MGFMKRFILNILKENKKEFIVITIIATIGSILTVIIPYIYGRLFDLALIPQTSINFLLSLILLWVVLGLISNYTSNKVSYKGEVVGAKIGLNEEAKAYSHFITLPISFHKKKKKGEILRKLSRGSWEIQSLIVNMSEIFPQFLILFFSIIVMVIIQWQLALILFFVFLIYSTITWRCIPPVIKQEDKMVKTFEKQYGNVYDKLYNVFLVKNFAMEENEKKRFFDSLVKKTLPNYKRSVKKWTNLSFYQGVIFNIGFVLVLGVAIFFLRAGSITQGEFIMFFGYTNLLFGPFWKLNNVYRAFKKSSVAIKRFIKLKQMAPESMKHGDKILEDVRGEVIFDNVSFKYLKDKDILKNINLKIKAGESVAIIGKSGVGKTTLSELIIGYYKPSRGRILLDGTDISKLKLKWLRE